MHGYSVPTTLSAQFSLLTLQHHWPQGYRRFSGSAFWITRIELEIISSKCYQSMRRLFSNNVKRDKTALTIVFTQPRGRGVYNLLWDHWDVGISPDFDTYQLETWKYYLISLNIISLICRVKIISELPASETYCEFSNIDDLVQQIHLLYIFYM